LARYTAGIVGLTRMDRKVSLSQEQPAEAAADLAVAPSVRASPKRICHVVATTEGAVWVYEQLRDLRDRFGYDVSVILNGPSGALVDRFKDAGIPVLTADFDFLGVSDLFALPRKIISLARTLRRERFDVVQTHLFHSMVIGRIGAWLADVPVRLSMVAGPFHLEAYTPRWIDGSTQWMDTALIPSCEWTRKLYKSLGVAEERLALIFYGPDEKKFDPVNHAAADLRREFGWEDDGPLIGMIAYFYAELGVNRWTPPAVQGRSVKCQSDVIRAMPEILAEFPKARLVLVGSGWEEGGRQYLSKMQSLVRDLNLADRVTFTGYRPDVPEVLKALDVTVQASLSENLGGTIEGLLMETPMVATRVGGLIDSVVDGETGILVAADDSASLAKGILTVLRDPDRARQLAKRGRQFMLERFTLRRTVESEHALYQKLLQRSPRGYRLHRTFGRLFSGAVICGYLAARYRFIDAGLLPRLDSGWRPWHFVRLRMYVLRIANALVRKLGTLQKGGRAAETRDQAATARRQTHASRAVNEQFISIQHVPPPPIGTALRTAMRMSLYRFYAFVGRRKLGWGLRRRASGFVRKLSRIPSALRIAMQMRLYRFYAFVGRRKLGWGLRRRASDMLRTLYRGK
jgi:glycosyltransferase involved in cell wall biosynthesis